jgi:hypothetical protein
MKNRGRSKPKYKFDDLPKIVFWILTTFILYLGYVAEIRRAVGEFYGTYAVGLTDGIIVVASPMALFINYLQYTRGKG